MRSTIADITRGKLDNGERCLVVKPSIYSRIFGKKIIIFGDFLKEEK